MDTSCYGYSEVIFFIDRRRLHIKSLTCHMVFITVIKTQRTSAVRVLEQCWEFPFPFHVRSGFELGTVSVRSVSLQDVCSVERLPLEFFPSGVLGDMGPKIENCDILSVARNSQLWKLWWNISKGRLFFSGRPQEVSLPPCRQKRSMGLTLAESELTKLDVERDKDRVTLERERACAEQIVAKIEEVL